MKTRNIAYALAAAMMLSACATPSLRGVPPYTHEIQRADAEIQSGALPPSRNLAETEWQNTLDRIAERIQTPAYNVCRAVQAQNCALVQYPIQLVEDDEINAYVDQDNQVSVHTGLIRYAANDEEIAAVLAHEYGHIFADHIGKSGQNRGAGMLIGAAIGLIATYHGYDPDGDLSLSLMEAGYNTGNLAYSPEFELEADYYAALILEKAGIDLSHGEDLLVRMARTNQGMNADSWEQQARLMATTHPANDFRLARWMGVSEAINHSYEVSPLMSDEELASAAFHGLLNGPLVNGYVARWVNSTNGHSGTTKLTYVSHRNKCDQVCVNYSNVVYRQNDQLSNSGFMCKVADSGWIPIGGGDELREAFGGCVTINAQDDRQAQAQPIEP